ncbi:PREDICTED: uncharacterized protein LOC109157793 [Ipomoea nil]|uniref:uncharacterized protein LOC109157793 n=1 Tax=Ipomoea nil TaxID=35883 RepID=UPI0009008DE0|nr:PREDICTED: uncharacterized protein LOC109157793 [Ipomoea nil]
MAKDLGIAKLIVENDSKALIDDIRATQRDHGFSTNTLWRCLCEASYFQEIEFAHIYREGNVVADKLASTALNFQAGYRDLQDAPIDLFEDLKLDQLGAVAFRHS